MKIWTRQGLAAAFGLAVVLSLSTTVRGSESVPIAGEVTAVKGTVTELNGFEAGIQALSDWVGETVWIGSRFAGSAYPTQGLAVDGDGTVYACASGYGAQSYSTTEVDLTSAVGSVAGTVKILSNGRARLKEKAGAGVTRMTFANVGTLTVGMSVQVTVEFKERSGNADTFHVFLADAATGTEYGAPDFPLFELMRSGSESGTYTLAPRYPLLGKDFDVICEIRHEAGDAASTSKMFVSKLALIDADPDGGVTGIVRYDPSDSDEPYKTVHQRPYGTDVSGTGPDVGRFTYQPIVSVLLAPVATDLFDEGDLLFLQVKSDEVWGWPRSRSEVWAMASDDANPSLVASADLDLTSSNGGATTLGVLADGTLILGGSALYKLAYDPVAGEYDEDAELIVFGQVYASTVNALGDGVVATMRTGNEKTIVEIDPTDGTVAALALLTDHVSKTRGLLFDSDGVLWWAGRKANQAAPAYFLGSPRGSKNKINYKRRLIEWTSGVQTVIAGQDDHLYALTRDADGVHHVYQIAK